MNLPPLTEVLPHRPPMILLDSIQSYEPPEICCSVTIGEESMFAEPDGVPAIVAMEYMAQCAAAYAGMQKHYGDGGGPQPGYLLGTRCIDLHVDRFRFADRLLVVAQHVWGRDGLASFDCEVTRDGRTMAIATLSVYEGPLPEERPPE